MEEKNAEKKPFGFIKKIFDFIAKDTQRENESKKITVLIRAIIISFIIYFIINILCSNIAFGNGTSFLFFGSFLFILISIFAASYYFSTKVTLWLFNIGTVIWFIGMLDSFGWDIGVQHFIMVLLLLYYFSNYRHYTEKVLFSIGACALRIVLFFRYSSATPRWVLDAREQNTIQILSTVTIFWCLSLIAFIFSRDSQELEGKLIDYNNQLEKLAGTDALTGLYNRRKAMELMESALGSRGDLDGFSLCICDIDFFKKVNDNYGHDFGDEVLKAVAKILKDSMGKNIIAARWGGEEFLLIFTKDNGDDAYIHLEGIQDKIRRMRVNYKDEAVGVTLTFGLAEYDYSLGLEGTLKEADDKLYMGKEKGRDIIIY